MTGVLYHSPADIVTQLLVDLGLADAHEDTDEHLTGWDVCSSHLPEDPVNAIVVIDTSSRPHRRNQVTGVIGEHYGIQVLVRASDITDCYKRAKLIAESFDTDVRRDEVELEDEDAEVTRTYRVNAVTRLGLPVPAGNDGRIFFRSLNALASIELVADEEAETGTGS